MTSASRAALLPAPFLVFGCFRWSSCGARSLCFLEVINFPTPRHHRAWRCRAGPGAGSESPLRVAVARRSAHKLSQVPWRRWAVLGRKLGSPAPSPSSGCSAGGGSVCSRGGGPWEAGGVLPPRWRRGGGLGAGRAAGSPQHLHLPRGARARLRVRGWRKLLSLGLECNLDKPQGRG